MWSVCVECMCGVYVCFPLITADNMCALNDFIIFRLFLTSKLTTFLLPMFSRDAKVPTHHIVA